MPLILGANKLSDSGYQLNNSLRFNSGSNDNLSKTFTSPTNNKIFTWSGWLKRGNIGTSGPQTIFRTAGATSTGFRFADTSIDSNMDGIRFFFDNATSGDLNTTQKFRDVSAWYHLVVAVDTTQATASNRVKMYINGSQITAFSTATYPALNHNPLMNSAIGHIIGKYSVNTSENYSGYMSDVFFIDGQQLTPSSFGETDSATGIWIPKAYTGTYGTNGFYLQFKNSASLGTDSSGNGNTFTVNNLTSIDQTTDTPINNFATINTLTCNDTGTLTSADGNLTITGGNDMGATIGITKGKWYWESKRSNTGTVAHWGIIFDNSFFSSTQLVSGTQSSGYFFRDDFSGGLYVQNSGANGFTNISSSSTGSSVANGDIIGFALDLDSATKSVTFYQNGSQVATATFSYNGTSSTCFPYVRNNTAAQSQWNFGNPPFAIVSGNTDANDYGNFEYAPPSGYYAICSKNLAEYG